MSLETTLARLVDRLERLERIQSRQDTRLNNIMREGKVVEVDHKNGLAIVDAHGVRTKPIPWLQQAGDIVEWNPPAVGQRVVVMSPDGEIGRGFIMPGGFTDQVPAPHDKGAERRTKIGNCVLTQSENGLSLTVGGTTFDFTADGFDQTGGRQTHDGVLTDKDHVHGDVTPGSANTGKPV